MRSFLNRALPFCLALFVGVALAGAVGHKRSKHRGWNSCHRSWASHHLNNVTPLKIESVPDVEFGNASKSNDSQGSLRLIALFDADGIVKEVRPYPMLPFGVPESEAGHGEFAEYTARMVDGHFVKQLPSGFVGPVIKQVRSVAFTPKMVGGQAVSDLLMVTADSDGVVILMDDSGTLWRDNPWRHGVVVHNAVRK